jgi:hypothetical protein
MSELLVMAAAMLGGAVFLHAFYRTVRLQWPQSYYSLGDVTSYRLSASPGRYLLFRFGPVLLAVVFISVLMERADLNVMVTAMGVALLHVWATSGRAAVRLLVSKKRMFNRPALLVSHAVISLGVVCIALAAGIVAPWLDWLVPTTAEVTGALWTAILAAVLGSYLVTVSRAQGPDIGEIVERAKRQLGHELWSLAHRSALEHDADPVLVRGILIVESLQRPQWLRFLERLKGIAIKEGSYGVMQVQASRPISDEESIS